MNYLKFVVALLVGLLSHASWAQNTSRVLVFKDGETFERMVSGEIDLSFFDHLKVIDNGVEKSFDPTEIDGFSFENGRYFLSKQLRGTEKRAFFQILVEGEKSLGVLRSSYYLILGDEAILLKVDSKGTSSMVSRELKKKSYLGVLHYAMDDCSPELVDQINTVNLSYPSLEKLFIAYHTCKGLDYQLHGSTIPYFKLGVSAAIGYGFLNPTMGPLKFTDQTTSPNFEVLLDLTFQKIIPRSKVQLGMSYLSLSDTWSYADNEFNPGDERNYYEEEFDMRIIKLPLILNYNIIHQEQQSVYLGAGITYSLIKKESVSEVSQWEYNSPYQENTVITRPRDPILLESRNTVGFLGKLGYRRKLNSAWIYSEFQFDKFNNLGYTVFPFDAINKYSMTMNSLKIGVSF
ncbi:hypothetical protein [Algoriphagus namhaensis]